MANYGYLQVTRRCNQKCRFCSNPPTGKVLSITKAKQIIDQHIKEGCQGIILTGGEPTLFKGLTELISYCCNKNIDCKIITNGQKLANKKFLNQLIKAGLKQFHISFYSYQPKIQVFLSGNKNSLKNINQALKNLAEKDNVSTVINIVINKYNADHLNANVEWLLKQFPFISHFVWNNLDPTTNRASQNKDTIPRLIDFEIELKKATDFLIKNKKTFRVERVPLCYMPGFEHYSTETRKIVKSEARNIYFLDNKRSYFKEVIWEHDKAECCKDCKLNDICAGLYEMDKYYNSNELYPVFVDPQNIVNRIINDRIK